MRNKQDVAPLLTRVFYESVKFIDMHLHERAHFLSVLKMLSGAIHNYVYTTEACLWWDSARTL